MDEFWIEVKYPDGTTLTVSSEAIQEDAIREKFGLPPNGIDAFKAREERTRQNE